MTVWTPRRILTILAPLYVAIAFALSTLAGCDAIEKITWAITNGKQLHARLGDFTAGTTRHAHSWDEVNDRLRACVEQHFGGHFEATVDSLFRGGIWIVDEQYSRYVFWVNDDPFKPRLEMGHWAYRNGDVLTHELAHAYIHDAVDSAGRHYLRNPADSLGQQGEYDHASPLFRACVAYCPIAEAGCRR